MSAQVLLGKPAADAIRADVARRTSLLADAGKAVRLATLRVGMRAEDVAYESSLVRASATCGIEVVPQQFATSVTTDELADAIEDINDDVRIDGCLLFRPLPAHIDEVAVCNAIAPGKDVDGVGAASLAGVFAGYGAGFAPATAEACVEMLDFYDVPIEGARVAVVGRSLVIGRPVAMMLLARNATVTLCHSKTADLPAVTRSADILVAAIGHARFFDGAFIREGQTVLDVGINDDGAGGLAGDVDFDAAIEACARITPVPRGIGSVSTAVLLRHVVTAAEAHVAGGTA